MIRLHETCSCGAEYTYEGGSDTDARYGARDWRAEHRHETQTVRIPFVGDPDRLDLPENGNGLVPDVFLDAARPLVDRHNAADDQEGPA